MFSRIFLHFRGRARTAGLELANRRYRPLSHLSKLFSYKALRQSGRLVIFRFTTPLRTKKAWPERGYCPGHEQSNRTFGSVAISESYSSPDPASRKPADPVPAGLPTSTRINPDKPNPEFPLYPHPPGKWAKKIRRRLHFFRRWEDLDGALEDSWSLQVRLV
jgi:hypothetical protein